MESKCESINNMKVTKLELLELGDNVGESFMIVGVAHIVKVAVGGEANSDATGGKYC